MGHRVQADQSGHWNKHAAQWQHVGPPLRPTAQDVALLERLLRDWWAGRDTGAPQALLLGVTPEIASMDWPAGTRLLAVDRCQGMIAGVWQAPALAQAEVQCADWLDLPLPDHSRDLAVGDGCFTLLPYPDGYQALFGSLRRVLRDDGLLVMRFFVRPPQAESGDRVFDDLLAGRIGNFHVFKWRLAMALHGSSEQGIRLADIWDAWHDAGIDTAALAARLGWMPESIATIDVYRDVQTRYTFPTLDEVRAIAADCFAEQSCHVGDYELAERCPTLTFRPAS